MAGIKVEADPVATGTKANAGKVYRQPDLRNS